MKEISLNILDITENSTKAGASLVKIELIETATVLTVRITDNGCGMSGETVRRVTDPFYTTRTTRKVGLGIPLFKMSAEQTGGSFEIKSKQESEFPDSHGTVVTAVFNTDHIDCTPLGDIVSTLTTIIQGHPTTDFEFSHQKNGKTVELKTADLREVLGDDVSLAEYEVIKWIEDFLQEQYNNL